MNPREANDDRGLLSQTFAEVLSPADVKGILSLSWRYHDPRARDSVWTYVPTLRRTRQVSPANRSDGFLGSDLSQDDGPYFDGKVPEDRQSLLRLPGVGSYTAAAIRSFAYGRREIVLDTNVRRVLARLVSGVAYPSSTTTERERRLAEELAPRSPQRAARWAIASMELGAMVCRARNPRCDACPVATLCAWRQAGYPVWNGAPRRGQAYAGTDRQCRGALLAVLRSSEEPITGHELAQAWQDLGQRNRALASLVADGLVVANGNRWSLPA